MKTSPIVSSSLLGRFCLIRHSLFHPSPIGLLAVLALLLPLAGWPSRIYAAYTPYYIDQLSAAGIDPTYWHQNGIGGVSGLSYGLVSSDPNGVALISKITPPSPATDYEVKMGVKIFSSSGGSTGFTYVQYLRASNDALSGPTPQGSYYAVEVQNPTFNGEIDLGTATLVIYKRVGGVVTQLGSTVVPVERTVDSILYWHPRTILRSVIRGQQLAVYINGIQYLSVTDSGLATGLPGIGVRGMYIQPVELGPIDAVAPPAINPQAISTSEFPNFVDFQWQGASDDANGVGVAYYKIQRTGLSAQTIKTAEFTDATVAASTTYTYTFYAIDYHMNVSPGTAITVTTPPDGAIDPRRDGVRPNGSYWGAGGEQIDLLSGNLNFSLPLLTARGRTGWTIPVVLSYNSQMWRQDPGGTWKLGEDVGYGFGWKLQIGSITPYWSDPYTIHHYTFTDSSGAEYRLDINTSGVWWSSKDKIYVYYDSNSYKLYFPSGTFWTMGCVSVGTEQDSGTRYPTLIEDSNGNQVMVIYNYGLGAPWLNSSARINSIFDVRGRALDPNIGATTFQFTYNTDPLPHLTSIVNTIATSENYNFSYLAAQNLNSPFPPGTGFGTTTLLQGVTATGLSLSHTMLYDASGSGELTQVTLPYGGSLRWVYQSFTYNGTRTLREVTNRYLTKAAGATETNYAFSHDPGDSGRTIHASTTLNDPGGVGQKAWFFNTTGTWQMGLISSLEERTLPSQAVLRKQDYTWVQDAGLKPYIGSVLTTLDFGTGNQKQSKTEQTLDVYGNVFQTNVYDYGNLVTPARTYTNTYLTDSNYTSRYIGDRLTSSTVTNGSETITLVQNVYDGGIVELNKGTILNTHDDVNYSQSFTYRGNVYQTTRNGVISSRGVDLTGTTTAIFNNGYNQDITPAPGSNNDVPGLITPNSNTNLNMTLTYSSFLGITSETDPNASSTYITYDGYARPATSQSPYGATTTYAYTNSPPTTKATLNGRWTKTTTDGLGRTIKVEQANSTDTVFSVVDTEYDSCTCSPLGKMKRVSQPYAPGGTVYWTTYTYDALGRTTRIDLPDGNSYTTYVYAGNMVTVTDPAGKWKKFTTDAMGNLVKVTEPNPAGGADLDTNYSYNTTNKLSQVSMTRSSTTQTRTFSYNSKQQLQSVTYPESGTTSYTYNFDGTPNTRIDAKNQMVQYVYDSYKRVSQIKRFDISTGAENVCQKVFFYYDTDPYNTGFLQNGWGRLTVVEYFASPSNSCTTTDQSNGIRFIERYSYTVGGLMTKKRLYTRKNSSWPTSPYTGSVSDKYMEAAYTYDNEGKMVSVTYPGDDDTSLVGRKYTYTFDSLARPNKLTDDQTTPFDWAKEALYNAAGQVTQLKYGNIAYNYTETRSYNNLGQVTQIRSNDGSRDYLNMQYIYSATQNNGQISQSIDSVSGETINYTYDSLNRLIIAATQGPQWGLSFAYDGFGNRWSQTVTKGSGPSNSLTFNAATNRITSSYNYDSNGNVISMPYGTGYTTLGYDIENRLIQATNSNGTETYAYGPDNRRVYQKKSDGFEWVFFYGVNGDRLRTYQLQGINGFFVTNTNIYFAGRLVWGYGTTFQGAFHLDRLGSVRTNLRYYPFGEQQGSGTSSDKFATYYRDTSTGLDYAMNRYYGSSMGRFTTPDPYGGSASLTNPQSWNRYAYVNNDPVNKNDPSGLFLPRPRDEGGGGGGWWGGWYNWGWDWPRPSDPGYFFTDPAEPSGTGRGGSSSFLRVDRDSLSKEGSNQAKILDTLSQIVGNIDPNCAKYLSGYKQYIADLTGGEGVYIAHGKFSSRTTVAITGGRSDETNIPPGYAAIVVNDLGAFFKDGFRVNNGRLNSNTDKARAFILLHELGHALGAAEFESDWNNVEAGRRNDDRINKNCKETLDKFK